MVRIKICGFTRRQDIEDAVSLGVRILGINFVSSSPRFVRVKEAKKLLEGLPRDIIKVGVFVNPGEKFLFETAKVLNLEGVQLHGSEPPWLVKKLKERLSSGILVIKALRVRNSEFAGKIKAYKPDYFLLDSYSEKMYGGTGKSIDCGCLESLELPWNKIFLAGGITPGNVKEMISKFNPYAIDAASGVEIAPGVKDREKIKQLIQNIKEFYNDAA